MKILLTYLLLTSTIYCFSKNKYEVERILYQSISDRFNLAGLDLEKEISELENYFIMDGVFTGNSGDDLILFFKSLKDNNDFDGFISEDKYERIKIVSYFEFFQPICIDTITSISQKTINDSKLSDLQNAFVDLEFMKEPSLSKYGQIIGKSLRAKDYENKFYKTFAILFIAQTSNIDVGIITRQRNKQ
jgi:hypothetical protein